MSKLSKILLCLFVGVFILIGGLIVGANYLLKDSAPQLEKALTKFLGREVKVGDMNISGFPTFAVRLSKIAIPQTSEESKKGLTPPSLDSFEVTLQLPSLIKLSPRFTVSVVEPVITAISTESGIVIPGIDLGKPKKKLTTENNKTPSTKSAKTPAPSNKSSTSKFDTKKVNIDSFSIVNGEVNFLMPKENRSFNFKNVNLDSKFNLGKNKKVLLDFLNFKADEKSLGNIVLNLEGAEVPSGDAPFKVSNLVFNAVGINSTLSAKGILSNKNIELENFDTKIDFETLLTKLSKVFPDELKAVTPFGLKGKLLSKFKKLNLGSLISPNPSSFIDGTISLSDIGLSLPNNNGVNNLNGKIVLSEKSQETAGKYQSFSIPDLTMTVFSTLLTNGEQQLSIASRSDNKVNLSSKSINLDKFSLTTDGVDILLEKILFNLGTGKGSLKFNEKSLIKLGDLANSLVPLKGKDVAGNVNLKGDINISEFANISGNLTSLLRDVSYQLPTGKVKNVKGNLNIDILSKDNLFVKSENISARLNSEKINTNFNAEVKLPKLTANNFTVKTAGGVLKGNGKFDISNFNFNGIFNANGLKLNKLINLGGMSKSMPTIKGVLSSLNTKISGRLNENLFNSLNGNLDFNVKDTVIHELNIVGQVLKSFDNLSLFSGLFSKKLPKQFSKYLTESDTHVKELNYKSVINKGTSKIQDLDLLSDIFRLRGDGRMKLPKNDIRLNTTFIFNEEVTATLRTKIKELERLIGNSKKLSIPLSLIGDAPKLLVTPNFKQLLKQSASNALKQGASRILDKVLSKGKSKGGKKTKTKDILKGLLGAF